MWCSNGAVDKPSNHLNIQGAARMTTTLHPRGVNHLALSTRDMKGQLEFWCDVLGCPLRALYYMHGVDGAFHGFVELAPESYVAFVSTPTIPRTSSGASLTPAIPAVPSLSVGCSTSL